MSGPRSGEIFAFGSSDPAAFSLYREVNNVPWWRFWLSEWEKREARAMLIRYVVEAEAERIATTNKADR